jgi:hypothetical protein
MVLLRHKYVAPAKRDRGAATAVTDRSPDRRYLPPARRRSKSSRRDKSRSGKDRAGVTIVVCLIPAEEMTSTACKKEVVRRTSTANRSGSIA